MCHAGVRREIVVGDLTGRTGHIGEHVHDAPTAWMPTRWAARDSPSACAGMQAGPIDTWRGLPAGVACSPLRDGLDAPKLMSCCTEVPAY